MITIYSGLFTHPHGFYPTDWVERAIARHKKYCDCVDYDYQLVTNIPWGQKYPLRHAWSFGTTIKFVALDKFLCSGEDYFIWMDLDVYPTEAAMSYTLPLCNLLYAPLIRWGFSDTPGHEHMKCKREWCNHSSDYYALNTGMFVLTRSTAADLWGYINDLFTGYHIDSDAWWEALYDKQMTHSQETPWLYGSEEAIMEHWLNEELRLNKGLPEHLHFKFTQFPLAIHSVHPEDSPLFMHYYGPRKAEYPHEHMQV
jgi:hypothetical protein